MLVYRQIEHLFRYSGAPLVSALLLAGGGGRTG